MLATRLRVAADNVCKTANDAQTNDSQNLCQHKVGKCKANLFQRGLSQEHPELGFFTPYSASQGKQLENDIGIAKGTPERLVDQKCKQQGKKHSCAK